MARIVAHLPVDELGVRDRTARDVTAARHIQAIWLLARGRTVLKVSEVLPFVPRRVGDLAGRCNALGPNALGDQRRRNGRTASLLTTALLAALPERLKEPPEDGGLCGAAPRSRPGSRRISAGRRCIHSAAGTP